MVIELVILFRILLVLLFVALVGLVVTLIARKFFPKPEIVKNLEETKEKLELEKLRTTVYGLEKELQKEREENFKILLSDKD